MKFVAFAVAAVDRSYRWRSVGSRTSSLSDRSSQRSHVGGCPLGPGNERARLGTLLGRGKRLHG